MQNKVKHSHLTKMLIVQLFIIFYGIPELGRLVTGIDEQWTLSSVISLSCGLSLNVGAYALLSVVVLFLYLKVKQKRLIL